MVTMRIASSKNAHELEVARIERRQRRRESLYVDLLSYAATIEDIVERTEPIISRPSDPPPPPPSDEEQRRSGGPL